MTTSAPNIVLVMSDQHRADMMGCAGDAERPDAVARRVGRRGRPLLAGLVPGSAVHAGAGLVHDGALRARPRRLHQLVRDRHRTARPTRGRCGRPATTRRSWARPTSTSTSSSRCRTWTTWPGGSRHWASPRSSRRATSSWARSRPATPTTSPDSGLLDAYKKHIADRSYQGENEDGQNATKCVPMWDSTPMPLPLEAYVDAWHGQQAVRWIERYDRHGAVLPLRRLPGAPRPLGRARGGRGALPRTSTSPCPPRPGAPRSRGRAATARS